MEDSFKLTSAFDTNPDEVCKAIRCWVVEEVSGTISDDHASAVKFRLCSIAKRDTSGVFPLRGEKMKLTFPGSDGTKPTLIGDFKPVDHPTDVFSFVAKGVVTEGKLPGPLEKTL